MSDVSFSALFHSSVDEVLMVVRRERSCCYELIQGPLDGVLLIGVGGNINVMKVPVEGGGAQVRKLEQANGRAGELIRLPGVSDLVAAQRVERANAGLGFERHLNN